MNRFVIMAVATMACSGHDPGFDLPQPVSAPPQSTHAGLYAGFGRADITPAPGFPLAGNSLEGGQATGYRHRLYARALVLEDGAGERFAFVTADLGHFSSNVHRLTAERVRDRTGLGADRIIISATHTHSGPGSHYGVRSYNEESAAYAGYDPDMVEFIVDGFSRAIDTAFADMQPAKAAWDIVEVPAEEGLTRNRSLDAFLRNTNRVTNIQVDPDQADADQDQLRQEAVDRVFRLLRVDQCDTGWANCRPRGAFSVYAIHGTGNPSVNTLIDGDIHAIVERELERHIESLNPTLSSSDPSDCATRGDVMQSQSADCLFASRAFHLFANGTEGDVSPNHDPGTRCGLEEADKRIETGDAQLRFRVGRRPSGPRTPRPPEEWRRLGPRPVSDCLERARASTNRLGMALSRHAIRAFTNAGNKLEENHVIQRAFRSYSFKKDSAELGGVCSGPRSGTSNLAGAEDGRTRMNKWKFLFFIPSGIEEGGSAIDSAKTDPCFGAKLIALGPLQGLVVGGGGLPEFLQLTVVRIGNGVMAAVPIEVTTEAGMRMKQSIRTAFSDQSLDYVGIVGLANGYMQYLTTEEEYQIQSYEGGSNLYGPKTAQAFTAQLAALAASIPNGPPIVEVGPITATPGKEGRVLFQRSNGPPLQNIIRGVTGLVCSEGVLTGHWIDAFPGLFVPADGQVIELQRRRADGRWDVVAWDDDRFVEIHAVGPAESGYEWAVRWSPPSLEPGSYRLVLVARKVGDAGDFEAVPRDGVAVPIVECAA